MEDNGKTTTSNARIVRTFSAPVERVYKAFTTPEDM